MPSQQSPSITPEAFWIAFSTALRPSWNTEIEAWFYDDAPAWTGFLTKILIDMALVFHCHPDREYWPRVDLSYFDRPGADWEEWSREVAIEIENNVTWTEEISKLMEINAGLKVVVAYTPDRPSIHSVLDRFPAIYASRKYVTNPCAWLFIFGPRGGQLEDFIAFKFDGATLTEITGDTKIITSIDAHPST